MALSFPPSLPALPARPSTNSIRVMCLGGYSENLTIESWPEYLQFPPRIGDFLQSSAGTIKKIIQVIHATDEGGGQITVLMLGDDNTSSTASEGGQASETF